MDKDVAQQNRYMREQDKAVADNLRSQNARLDMLITNYRLNKQWKRIMFRMQVIEKVKSLWKRLMKVFRKEGKV